MDFSCTSSSHGCAACGYEHLVEFYETDELLVATVADYLSPGLRAYDSAIVVATAEHRDAFAAAIGAAGVNVDAATREGRYHAIDADELLSKIMVDGVVDPARFRQSVTSLLDRASAGDREVRVYGEMVALLWAAGDVASTIALEDLWNALAMQRGFSLFCGYPIRGFDVQSQSVFKHICSQHSRVVPAESHPLSATSDEQAHLVAELQQETASLRAELERLRSDQDGLTA
jgi:hypothetical protein